MRTAAALPLPEPAGDASGPEDRQLQLLSHLQPPYSTASMHFPQASAKMQLQLLSHLHPPLATGTVHLSHEFAPSAASPAPQHQG